MTDNNVDTLKTKASESTVTNTNVTHINVTNSTITQENEMHHTEANDTEPSLVPKGLTIGLAIFALILSLAGYVFRLIAGDSLIEVLKHAMLLVPLFLVVIPAGFWLGASIMNKVKGLDIQRRNAITLGFLISCVTMLWFMGTYS